MPEQTPTGGDGIPAERVLHVFRRFHRGVTAGNRKHRGSAIGLSDGRIIVDTHAGPPSAVKDGGRHGPTFEVRLPLEFEGTP